MVRYISVTAVAVFLSGCPIWLIPDDTMQYSVGDTGPAGGVVFYDDEADGTDDLAGARYLETVPAMNYQGTWGGFGYLVGTSAQDTTVGSGMSNSESILTTYGDTEPYGLYSNYAAKICLDLEYGGHDDWFLPSLGELQLMREHDELVGISGGSWWSSSELNSDSAYFLEFVFGDMTAATKDTELWVRPCRAF